MKQMKKKVSIVLAAGLAAAASGAQAAVDLSQITGAFTPTDVTAGVMSVAATLAVIYVSIKAARIVLGMLRGG
jgi:hypothetical protein